MLDRSELIEICHKVYDKGFVSAFDGNISSRIDENYYYITRSGICKGEVTKDDILIIDQSGKIIEGRGKVSTEYKIHLFSYNRRKEINAVIHSHPVYVSAFAAAGRTLPMNILPEVILTLGRIPICGYATPSTDQVPESLEPYIKSGWAYILQNHGALTLGENLKDAYFKLEKLEHTAKILFIADMLGGAKEIPEEKLKELRDIAGTVYGITDKNLL